MKADLLYDAGALLGEGPVWDETVQSLYWVDIEGCSLHCYMKGTGENLKWEFDGMLGAVIPCSDGSLLLAHENGFLRFEPRSGKQESTGILKNQDAGLRFNDGKCDPSGNIWIGTMDKELAPNAGQLYRHNSRGETAVMLSATSISNGMAWSGDHRYFYYIDSPTYEICRFNYDAVKATLSNKKVIVRIPELYGTPDGMTIDTDGNLWVAHWGGQCVRQWDPGTGKELFRIDVEAPHVTSCCFGGEDFRTLYITTARSGLDTAALEEFPVSGGLFSCRPGAIGLPPHRFHQKT